MAKLPLTAYPLLLQQRVIGPGVGVFLLLWDGDLVATFAHRRLREKPPSGGVSVYRESIRVDQSLIDRSRRLLDSFGWRGVAMIEYKLDEASGVPVIMEINGRFWGSLQLAIDAGVDFPSLLVARALGQKVYGPASYKVGIRSRWEWGGVDYLVARLRRSDAELSLPAGGPGRIRSVLSALLPWLPGDRLEVLRLGDPRPFLRETAQYFRRSTRRRASAT
jgi:predicted ATP-grasp superfamily ATP-dependent carboligase